jgi:hypothetical protein
VAQDVPLECKPVEASAVGGRDSAVARPAELPAEGLGQAARVVPKGKGQLSSDRVQNPHDPEATYAVKGQGQQKKEHTGYKIQVAESVSEAVLAPAEPTRNYLLGIVTPPAWKPTGWKRIGPTRVTRSET